MAFNPSAGIIEVVADTSGSNLKLDVHYWCRNDEGSWNTCIVIVKESTGEVWCKTHGMVADYDDHIVEPMIVGPLPTKEETYKVSILGHPDFYSQPPTYCG